MLTGSLTAGGQTGLYSVGREQRYQEYAAEEQQQYLGSYGLHPARATTAGCANAISGIWTKRVHL